MTPDYLAFAQLEERQPSPLEAAVSGAFKGYGDVQKLRQQTLLTKALPKEIAAQEKLQQQQIQLGELKQQYLPKQYKQEEEERQVTLNALPQLLRSRITNEQLTQMVNSLKIKHQQLSNDQLAGKTISGQLSVLSQLSKTPGITDDQLKGYYRDVKNNAKNLDWSQTKFLPDEYNDEAKALSDNYYKQSPAGISSHNAEEKFALQQMINNGKIGAAQVKNTGLQAGAKQAEIENQKYLTGVYHSSAGATRALLPLTRFRTALMLHPEYFGYIRGKFTGKITAEGQQLLSDANDAIVQETTELKGVSTIYRTTTMQKILLGSKMSLGQAYDAALETVNRHIAERLLLQQNGAFANFAEHHGVNNRGDITMSWANFESGAKIIDDEGKIHPERAYQWAQYYKKYPGQAPIGLQKIFNPTSTPSSVENTSGLITQYPNPNKVLGGG